MLRITLVAAVAACAVHAADVVVGEPSEVPAECKALNCPEACVQTDGKWGCTELTPWQPANPCQITRCSSDSRCIVGLDGKAKCVHWPFGCAPFGDKVCPEGKCCKEKFGFGYCGECEPTGPKICCLAIATCPPDFMEAKSTECNVLDHLTGRCRVVEMCCDSILCKKVPQY